MTNILMKSAVALAMLGLATTAGAKGYKEVDVANGGALAGTVAAGSAQPDTRDYTISKDPAVCGTGTRQVPFVQINDGKLMNAVVFLKDVKEGKAFDPDSINLTLNQKGCAFSPAMGVMANLGELTAINDDATLHNIHTYEIIGKARRTVMNVSQPNKGDVVTKKVKLRRGDGMKIECDAHDFMHGFVFVARNPYYSVVDENGAFSIEGIPAGTYKVVIWHGFLGEVDAGEVTIDAGGQVSMDLTY